MDGVAEPELLLDASQDPHHFHLKPSHVRLLSDAEIVFYMDEKFELFLQTVKDQGEWQKYVPLSEVVPEMEDESDHHWLNPALAHEMLGVIAHHLTYHYPEYQEQFEENLELNQTRLSQNAKLWRVLIPVEEQPSKRKRLAVDHDTLVPFTRYFELPNAVVIKSSHGALQVKELASLEQGVVACVFLTMPKDDGVSHIAEKLRARMVPIDPLGLKITMGSELLFNVLDDLVQRTAECLTRN